MLGRRDVSAMLKRFFENYLFFSRWLLAPFFVILSLSLVALLIKASKKLLDVVQLLTRASDYERITPAILSLIDATLIGALVVIVILSVYGNFVLSFGAEDAWPAWLHKIDFTQLKLTLLTTIVAISAIRLLEAFMDVEELSDRELYFYMGIHLTFVGSTLVLAIVDRLTSHRER